MKNFFLIEVTWVKGNTGGIPNQDNYLKRIMQTSAPDWLNMGVCTFFCVNHVKKTWLCLHNKYFSVKLFIYPYGERIGDSNFTTFTLGIVIEYVR